MMKITSAHMQALQRSPSSQYISWVVTGAQSPQIRSPVKDRDALILNIDRKFHKLTAFTTEGDNIKFYGHDASDVGAFQQKKIKFPRYAHSIINISQLPSQGKSTYRRKEEATKSMKKYERELEFKNRVLKIREERAFNQRMMDKLSKN